MLTAQHAHVCPFCHRWHACRDWQERGRGLFSVHAAIACDDCPEQETTIGRGLRPGSHLQPIVNTVKSPVPGA